MAMLSSLAHLGWHSSGGAFAVRLESACLVTGKLLLPISHLRRMINRQSEFSSHALSSPNVKEQLMHSNPDVDLEKKLGTRPEEDKSLRSFFPSGCSTFVQVSVACVSTNP